MSTIKTTNITHGSNSGTANMVLASDGGVTFANGAVLTEFDQWQITANHTGDWTIDDDIARDNNAFTTYVGSGMTQSSGVFTFPSTGKWLVKMAAVCKGNNVSEVFCESQITYSADSGSSFTGIASGFGTLHASGGWAYESSQAEVCLDITNTSTQKVQFKINFDNTNCILVGSASLTYTYFQFWRLGDT